MSQSSAQFPAPANVSSTAQSETLTMRAAFDTSNMPSGLWRMLTLRGALTKKLPQGLDAFYDRAIGIFVPLLPRMRQCIKRAKRVLAMQPEFEKLSDARLREHAEDMKALFRRGRDKKRDVERAFAIIREVAWRKLSMRPYMVQVAAGLAIVNGYIAEMSTGEGKTLMATLPATIFGWRGRGCHVITVNDYLAKRDAEEMTAVYKSCGLTCSHVDGTMCPFDRKQAYNADITYTTNKEVAADFLRDRLALGQVKDLPTALINKIATGAKDPNGNASSGVDQLVMRGLEYAIVDEADSVLIDEAVTPLIISGDSPNPEQTIAYEQAANVVKQLEPKTHYHVNQKYRDIKLTKAGEQQALKLTEPLGGLWHGARRREELIIQAISARELFKRDEAYVVEYEESEQAPSQSGAQTQTKSELKGKVVIVDESTGRLMPDRTWRDGLHQAVEAKENLEVTPPKATFARVSFQRFFRMYRNLSGMTGTAWEAKGELWQIYRRPTVIIPTNRKCIRKQKTDRIFANKQAKWDAIVQAIAQEHETGRPILIGTRNVDTSEYLSQRLHELKLDHLVLNAVRHEEEAFIVSGAGQSSKITVSTNMAGRGTDIKLGKKIADKGGLAVISAEHNDTGRVDRQLFGRAGRQGDPGSAITFASLEDDLIQRYAPRWMRWLITRMQITKGEIRNPFARRMFFIAQKRAQKMSLKQRKSVLHTDDWLDEFLGFAGREV